MAFAVKFEPGLKPVFKHGSGDQKPHGSWANGTANNNDMGGTGVDITESLKTIFGSTDGVVVSNPKTHASIKALQEKLASEGKAYGDIQLEMIAELQGFNGRPKAVETIEELKKVAEGGGQIVFRGVSDYSENVARAESMIQRNDSFDKGDVTLKATDIAQDFVTGSYRAGWGYFGNGIYTTNDAQLAAHYAQQRDIDNGNMGNGVIIAMAIPKSARMPSKEVVKMAMKESVTFTGSRDVGRNLAAKGYQAYDSGFVQSDKMGNIIVLDRSMVTALSKPLVNWLEVSDSLKKGSDRQAMVITPAQSHAFARIVRTFNSAQRDAYYDAILSRVQAEDYLAEYIHLVQKHGTGDQKPHGSWADQGLSFAGLKAQKFIDGGGTLSETLSSKDSKVLEAKTMVEQMSAKLGFDFAIDYGVLQTMEAIRGIQIGIPLEPDNVIIAYDKNGAIAGAISFNRIDFKGRTPLLFINHLGSTGIIDGTGSSLTRRVIKLAASEKREMQLFALDSNATKFWEKMGFDDEMYSGMSMGMTLENVQSEASK